MFVRGFGAALLCLVVIVVVGWLSMLSWPGFATA
jgi:hypothetical protein